MPRQVQAAYAEWLGGPPVLLDASSCGWVARRRFFWLRSRNGALGPGHPPPDSWTWRQAPAGVAELRYNGKKPLPSQVFWDDHFLPMLQPPLVMQNEGKGAMHTFTREFYHPVDRVPEVSPAAAERFHADCRRFPPGAYEEHSLLWAGHQWRQPSPVERCQIMCLPPAVVAPARGGQVKRVQTQNSLIGNGFHIPSVVALLAMLPSILEAKMVMTLPDTEEQRLQERLPTRSGNRGGCGLCQASCQLLIFARTFDSSSSLPMSRSTPGPESKPAWRHVTCAASRLFRCGGGFVRSPSNSWAQCLFGAAFALPSLRA